MSLSPFHRSFTTSLLLRALSPACTSRVLAGGLFVGTLSAAQTNAQLAYFSFEGDFVSAGDQLDFGLDVDWAGLSTADDVGFQTFAQSGGTNRAGDVIGTGGIDSFLELLNTATGSTSYGKNDDYIFSGFDSLLTWEVNGTPNTPPDSVPLSTTNLPPGAGDFVRLKEFNDNDAGAWAMDLFGPADRFEIQSVVNASLSTGTATIDTFKFGTTGPGTTPAAATFDEDIVVLGDLVVGQTGNAQLTITTPGPSMSRTFTVGGTTTVNPGGAVVIHRGTFDADGPVVIDGGSFATVTDGLFDLALGQAFTASNDASVSLVGDIDITGTTYTIQSGADFTVTGGLDVSFANSTRLIIDGVGSTLTVGQLGSSTPFVVGSGSTETDANVTLRNSASATINDGLDVGNASDALVDATFDIESGATLTVDDINIGTGTAGTGAMTVTGLGTMVTQNGAATLTLNPTSGMGDGTLTISDSGAFNTGTGLITINADGEVNLTTGGAFNVAGDLLLSGGALAVDSTSALVFNQNVTIGNGMLDWDSAPLVLFGGSGNTLTASSDAQVDIDGIAGAIAVDNANALEILSGADLSITVGEFLIGENAGDGQVTVSSLGSTMQVSGLLTIANGTSTGTLAVSDQGSFTAIGGVTALGTQGTGPTTDATLTVDSAAQFTAVDLSVGGVDGAQGAATIHLDGAGSTLMQNGSSTLTLGNIDTPINGGVHAINVTDQAIFNTGSGVTTINTTGTLTINTSGVFNANGEVNVVGGAIHTATNGVLSLATGQLFTASSDAELIFNGPTAQLLDDSQTLVFNSGADVSFATPLVIGDGTTSQITVDGAGSSLTASMAVNIASNAGAGTLTFSDQATGTLADIGVGDGGVAGVFGTLNVLTDADVTSDSLLVSDLATSNGIVNVNGAGSSYTVQGGGVISVGNATAGNGEINIAESAIFTAGTGLTTINPTGTLAINTSGVFNANGDVTVDGGTLNAMNSGELIFASGTTLTAANAATVSLGDTYDMPGEVTFLIQSGSTITFVTNMNVGSSSAAGTIIVEGVGSQLVTQSLGSDIGKEGGTGTVTFRDQAAGVFGGSNLELASDGSSATQGTLNIESGATVQVNAMLAIGDNPNGSGAVVVTGVGSMLTQSGSHHLTLGSADLSSTGTSSFTVSDSGAFTSGTGTVTVNQNGTLNVAGGSFNTPTGAVVINNGALNISSGEITLGTLDLNGTASVNLNGTGMLRAQDIDFTQIGSVFSFTDGTLSVDTFIGTLQQSGGTLSPGPAIGTASLSGYNLSDGTVAIEIGGTAPGTEHDRVDVGGLIGLGSGSILEVTLSNGFSPSAGDSFDVLDFSSIIGNFGQLNLPVLGAGIGWDTSLFDSSGILSVVSTILPGDTDGDGDIDDSDLGTSFANYTGPVGAAGGKTMAQGDTDGDGDVDDSDLGNSFTGYTGPMGPTSVPEPTSLALLAVGAWMGMRRRDRV